jgi:predicted RNA-binding protein with TRAM domain
MSALVNSVITVNAKQNFDNSPAQQCALSSQKRSAAAAAAHGLEQNSSRDLVEQCSSSYISYFQWQLPVQVATIMADQDLDFEHEEMSEDDGGRNPAPAPTVASKIQRGRGHQSSDDRGARGGVYDRLQSDAKTAGGARSIEGWVIFVTGVHEEATEDDIIDAFAVSEVSYRVMLLMYSCCASAIDDL